MPATDEFRILATEADRPGDQGRETLDAPYDDYPAVRAEHDPHELSRPMVTATNSSHLTGVPTYEIVRLERVAEEVAPDSTPATFAARFADALQVAAVGAVGFKSIIAYRYGLDVEDVTPTPAEVAAAFEEWQRTAEREQRVRITSPVLMKRILWEAVGLGLPKHYMVSALDWRRALGAILDDWIGDGWVPAGEAERLAVLRASGNAERIDDPERR